MTDQDSRNTERLRQDDPMKTMDHDADRQPPPEKSQGSDSRKPGLKILFATAHPHLPQIAGGLQSSTQETMRLLTERGHETRLLCGLTGAGLLGLRHRLTLKLRRRHIGIDKATGQVTYRVWHSADPAALAEVRDHFHPDVVVAQGGGAVRLASACGALDLPAMIHFRNVEFAGLRAEVAALDPATIFISNSNFTRTRARADLGVDSRVIYPVIDAATYRVLPGGSHCVFVNPHPSKGIAIALELAKACPDIPFLIVEAWTLDGPEHSANRQRAAALRNITWLRRIADMRVVYAQARLILVPSRWEEAFGRVVAEAQVSGIPAIVSDIGGLPEAVGPGGIRVSPTAPVETWRKALRRVWDDPTEQARLATAALRHAGRAEMAASAQIDALENALYERIGTAKAMAVGG
ncbi:MAG: glycosyl transferase family 1 [Rhodobacteraceae bacterium PARR1]|nr:MAG: glycosyl transferase family 1 [Rhodobacteraceae bacterium PARR1]